MSELAEAVAGWQPEPAASTDTLRREPIDAFAALLDQPVPPEFLPPLWHWFFFLEYPRSAELGPDGHPSHGHFLPPVPRRRRMFAGGRLEVRRPLAIGARVERTARITGITPKSGRSGDLLFVTERRELSDGDGVAVVEEQDIVYRQAPPEGTEPAPVDRRPQGDRSIVEPPPGRIGLRTDPTLLFRFSALTYNAHRIHYDQPYASGVEGYPYLVVHGPLLALLLLEPARRAGRSPDVAAFHFRLRRPAFAGAAVVVATAPELSAGTVGAEPAATGSISWR